MPLKRWLHVMALSQFLILERANLSAMASTIV